MAIYRWIGSGNTGSTSANIFSWNNTGNWRKRVQITPSRYIWAYTNNVPSGGDDVYFGYIDAALPGVSGATAYGGLEKTKSPCLFGGFAGNIAGGTWSGGVSGGYGTTFASVLSSLQVYNNSLTDGLLDIQYGENEYGLQNMPLGGGLSSGTAYLDNLEWVARNYPNMGVTVSNSPLGFTASVNASYDSTWDALTIKCYSTGIVNYGLSAYPGNISLNYVTSYRTLGTSGGLVAENTLSIASSKDVSISGGAFRSIISKKFLDVPSSVARFYPQFTFSNMSVEDIKLNGWGKNLINNDVKFIDMTIDNEETAQYVYANQVLPESRVTTPPITHVLGSGSVTTVNSVIYPGNTANTNSRKSKISFERNYKPQYETSNPGGSASYITRSVEHWNTLSLAHEQLNSPNQASGSLPYFLDIEQSIGAFIKGLTAGGLSITDPVSGSIIEPYTTQLLLGEVQGVTSVDVGQVIIKNNTVSSDSRVCMLKMEGQVNVNEVYLGNYTMMKCVDRGASATGSKIQIGELRLAPLATLNLDRSRDYYYFGVRNSSGVCGGIMASQPGDFVDEGSNLAQPVGRIVFPQYGSIRLFNVNTGKGGSIQIPVAGDVADIAQVSGVNKKG
jgi:hypothetical protein